MGYLDTIGSCNCHHRQDADITRGYLGWYENLNEVLKRYPTPRIGWSFNNVETRSVWIYDGRRWCNTTQGNPFTMITDVNNAGAMRNGYAQTFYYIPTKADVNGGTITFRFDVEGKELFCDVDVWSISDIVFLEWTGSTINTSVHQLDDSVVKHVEQSLTDAQKLQARENIGAIGSEQVTNETNGSQYDVLQKGGRHIYPLTMSYNVKYMNTTVYEAIEKLKEKDTNLDETVVKHIAQSLTDAQKLQAQINIGAVSKAEEEDHMLWKGRIYYPETTTEYVRVPGENKNLATLLTELSSILNGVVKDVETFLSDADVSESAKDTLRELQEYINQDVAAAAEMLASINKLKTEKVDVAGGNVTNTVVELGGDLTPLGAALESAATGFNEIAIEQGKAAARIDHLDTTKQDSLTLTVKDNGNIVIGNIQGQTKEFMPATPSGDPNHYMYEQCGAVWNGDTGYWELNGLTDMTNEDMRASYLRCNMYSDILLDSAKYMGKLFRTNILGNIVMPATLPVNAAQQIFRGNPELEVLNFKFNFNGSESPLYNFNNMDYCFYKCTALRSILGTIKCTNASFTEAFKGCKSLTNIKLLNVSKNISFADSPISKESLLCLINNAGTATFTITLRADTYAWASVDEDIQAALAVKTNITLQSA